MAENETYKVEITETSREFTKRERVRIKTSAANKIVDLEEGTSIAIRDYAKVHITNDKSVEGEYDSYIFIDEDGELYSTSSNAFFRSYKSIKEEMEDEPFDIIIKRIPGKKGTNNETILCDIAPF